MTNEGFDCFKTYIAVKNHFNQANYDYFKYNGKAKVNQDSFNKRRDKFFFAKLSRKYRKEELPYFFACNLANDSKAWAGSLVNSESEERYQEWKKRYESLPYVFKQDCWKLQEVIESTGKTFDDLFAVGNTHPPLIKLYFQGEILLETIVILDKILKYSKIFNKYYADDVTWENSHMLIRKYGAFLDVDTKKYKSIMKTVFL